MTPERNTRRILQLEREIPRLVLEWLHIPASDERHYTLRSKIELYQTEYRERLEWKTEQRYRGGGGMI